MSHGRSRIPTEDRVAEVEVGGAACPKGQRTHPAALRAPWLAGFVPAPEAPCDLSDHPGGHWHPWRVEPRICTGASDRGQPRCRTVRRNPCLLSSVPPPNEGTPRRGNELDRGCCVACRRTLTCQGAQLSVVVPEAGDRVGEGTASGGDRPWYRLGDRLLGRCEVGRENAQRAVSRTSTTLLK